MTISSSLNASVMGLNANATRLASISDNIANSGTYGYKDSVTEFSSLVQQDNTAFYTAGGVKADTYKDVERLGSLVNTGNPTDLAVSGRGLFPVTDPTGVNEPGSERTLMLTPTGSFTPDQNGNLRTQSGLFLLGWPADADGNVGNISRDSGTSLQPVNIAAEQFTASPTTQIDLAINLPANATRAAEDGSPLTLPIEYFDNLGRSNTLTLRFSPTVPATGTSNQWQVDIFDSAGDPATSIGTLDLTFDDSIGAGGRLLSATAGGATSYDAVTGNVSFALPHGPVNLNIGPPGADGGLSQLAAPYSPTNVTKDGSPIGDLQAVEIDEDGFLQAIYDTGFRRALFQIPVGDVPNMNGLTPLDSQAYALSPSSGNMYLWDAGSGPTGSVASYTLMESTTDIASELTDLIETQRAYSSNAKIVQTVDEMLQETTNLKR